MRKYPLIWFVWVSFPEELSTVMYALYVELCTIQSRKYDTRHCHTASSSFCTFKHIKQAERFAQMVADAVNADVDIISNRQRKKWKKRGVYTGYVVTSAT